MSLNRYPIFNLQGSVPKGIAQHTSLHPLTSKQVETARRGRARSEIGSTAHCSRAATTCTERWAWSPAVCTICHQFHQLAPGQNLQPGEGKQTIFGWIQMVLFSAVHSFRPSCSFQGIPCRGNAAAPHCGQWHHNSGHWRYTPTGIRRSGGDRFTEQLGRGWWFRVDLVGSRSVCPECMWRQYSGPWGPQFLYDVVSSVRIQTSHVGYPELILINVKMTAFIGSLTSQLKTIMLTYVHSFEGSVTKLEKQTWTSHKVWRSPISRKVPKSSSQIYAIWVRQTASAPSSSLDATWMDWTRALPNWAIQQLQVIYV